MSIDVDTTKATLVKLVNSLAAVQVALVQLAASQEKASAEVDKFVEATAPLEMGTP